MSRLLSADRIVGFILLILCCLFTYFAFDLAKTIPPFFKNQPMRVDTLPRILGVAGILASIVTIIAPTTGAKREPENKQLKENEDRMADLSFANFGQAKWGQLVAMIALMIVYSTYLRAGGFIPSTFCLLLFGSIILGERRWIAMIIVSVVAPLAIWLLVTYVLDRTIPPLPKALMNMLGG
jgi:putative tricarboxylic transport membrane protein